MLKNAFIVLVVFQLFAILCVTNLTAQTQSCFSVITTENGVISIKFDQDSSNNLIPEFSSLNIRFNTFPIDSVFIIKNKNDSIKLTKLYKDSSIFQIQTMQINPSGSLMAGSELVLRWYVNNIKKQTKLTIYPTPKVECNIDTCKLGNEVIIKIGPFLRKPEPIVIYPKSGLGLPAQIIKIEKEWTENDNTLDIRCIFNKQPKNYKMIIFDRNHPYSLVFPQIKKTSGIETLYESKDYTEIDLNDYIKNDFKAFELPTFKLIVKDEEISIAREKDIIKEIKLKSLESSDEANKFKKLFDEKIKISPIYLYNRDKPDIKVAELYFQNELTRLEIKSICDQCVAKIEKEGKYITALINLRIFKEIDVDFTIENSELYPGDSVILHVSSSVKQTEGLIPTFVSYDKDASFTYDSISSYKAIIPKTLKSGTYQINWKSKYSSNTLITGKTITVKEFSICEDFNKFISLTPSNNSINAENPIFINKSEVQNLKILLNRKAIRKNAGPQFFKIRITVTNKDGNLINLKDIRAVTFNPEDPRGKNEERGPYASYLSTFNLNSKSFWKMSTIPLKLDEIPYWSIIKVEITPDEEYHNIGYDELKEFKRFYCVKGPWANVTPSFGIPKVLVPYEFHSGIVKNDSLDYGSASVMLKLFFLNDFGKRFPISIGLGIYGLSASTNKFQGGGGVPILGSVDLLELFRYLNVQITDIAQISCDCALFIPFNYPYTRILFSLSASITP